MPTVGFSGRAMIVKFDKGSSSYVELPGLRVTSWKASNSMVEITSKDDVSTATATSGQLYRKLLPQGAACAVTLSASGIFTDSSLIAIIRKRLMAGTFQNMTCLFPGTSNKGADTMSGSFMITDMTEGGTYDTPQEYSFTFESSGVVGITL